LYFAQALVVSPMASKISGGIITIFVDRDISICTQSSDISFTESLEIPFQLISEAKIEATLLEGATSSATPPVDLVVELKISGKVSCYMNALPVNIGGLRITVRDRGLARFIGDEFLNPRHFKKASQSKETIAIAPGFYNAVSPQESEVVGDSNEEGTKFRHDPAITRPREKSQNDVQNVEFNNFIEESPQDNQTRETDTQPNLELGEFVAEGADSAARPIYEDNQDVAVDPVRFRSSAPARLSHRSGNDIAASVDKEENMRQDIDLPNHASKRTLRGKAHLRPSVLKPTVPEPTPDEESQEMTEPPPSPVASPVESTQQKAKSARLNAEVNPEDEKKTLLKPAIPKGETKRAKKYSLKPKAAAPITKTAASKRATALRARATVSKAGPKVSDSKLAAVPKPNPTSKGIPAPAAKAPKKKISKLLVPKKLALKDIPKLPTRQFQTHQSELNLKSQEMETAPTSPKSLVAMSLDLDAQRSLMQEGKATDRHASRLSAALADIEDIEHQDASFGELVQTSLIYQPPNVTTQTESSSSPVLRRTATPAQEEHSPGQFLLELMPVLSKNCANQPPQGSMRSESSPSSLVRVTPVPLPAQEESPAECFIQEATSVPSKILAGYIGPRRSPRLASHYSIREASVALGRVRAVAPCPARKPAVIDLSDNDEPKCQDGGSDDDSPSRADEIPLFDDYLARKTPLVSFGAKGPRNQGIPSLKKCSLQRVEEPENRPLLIQTYMPTQRGKRKRAKEDAPMVENNKRQQNYRLQKSMDKKPEATKVLPLAFRDAEDLIMPRNRPAARNTARFGSQGSRVNENGSPRGHSNNFQEPASHNKIARKALRDVKPTEITGEDDGDGYFHYDDDSGLNMVDNDQGFLLDPPVILYSEGEGPSMREGHQPVYDYATSSSSFKVRPLSPCPDEEVVKRHLPRKKNTNFQDPKVGTKVVHHQQGKLADPFLKESPEIDLSSFARRLQYRQQTPTRKIRDDPTAPTPRKTRYTMNEDPEVTLVNAENEIQVRELSSSSDMTSESSDEAQNPRSHKVALEVHQAQRDEWRMALKPHQRGILDVLNQVSTVGITHSIS
jgi:hypothetical protein